MFNEPLYDDVPPLDDERRTEQAESAESCSTASARSPPPVELDKSAWQHWRGDDACSPSRVAASAEATYSMPFQRRRPAAPLGPQDATPWPTGRPGATDASGSSAQATTAAVAARAQSSGTEREEKANTVVSASVGDDEDGGVYVDLATCVRWRPHGALASTEAVDSGDGRSVQALHGLTAAGLGAAQDDDSTRAAYFILENKNCHSDQVQAGGPAAIAPAGLTLIADQTIYSSTSSINDEPIYEPVAIEPDVSGSPGTGDPGSARTSYEDEDDIWTISEFEAVSTSTGSAANTMPRTKSSTSQGETILERIAGRLSFKLAKPPPAAMLEKFQINRDKHPLPALPPMPDGLSEGQLKRRYVVESIINIENSYVNSLLRLQQHYVFPLKQSPSIISLDKTDSIFAYLDDILKCHLMFQVALEECAKNWDTNEQIGSQFVSSFSKSMVLESYAAYVNNFLTSTSLVKRLARERQPFEAFLVERQRSSPDKVDVIGLMLKPVQRFPQYILQIKDLIKYTSRDHPDYLDLLHALTTLESIAYELNERKRSSEEKLAAKVVLKKLDIKPAAEDSYLVRQDDVERVEYTPDGQVLRRKPNRLLLFSDMLVCLRIDSDNKEKYYLKWYVPIGKVDYHDACRTSAATGSSISENGESVATATFDRLQQELTNLRHDEELLHRIYELVSGLRQSYKGMTTEDVERHVAAVMHDITICHEQLKMHDSCTVRLSLSPLSTGGSSSRTVAKAKRVFQLLSPEVKQDWVLDFRAAKLAEGSQNKDGWRGNVEMLKYPLLVKSLPVDITRDGFQVFCATSVFLVSTSGGIGLQYLWLCGGKDGVGQVTIVCLHANSPYVVESFKACHAPITAVCQIPGSYYADDDQVWMASGCTIFVYGSASGQHYRYHTETTRTLPMPAPVVAMHCIGAFVYVALGDGSLLKCAVRAGSPLYTNPCACRLSGSIPVSCVVPADRWRLYCAIDKALYLINIKGNMSVLESHELSCATSSIQCVIKIGLGLWVSFLEDPILRMYHADTYEFLQDVNIDSAVHKLLPDVSKEQLVYVTTMTFNQGLLWIGTSSGVILTVPIPVVQGVPRIFGGMSISMNGHCSPVHFLLSITCSLTSAPKCVSKSDLSPLPEEQQRERADSGATTSVTDVVTRRWSADDAATSRAADCNNETQAGQATPVSPKPDSASSSKLRPPSRSASTKGSSDAGAARLQQQPAAKAPKNKRTNIFARRKPAPSSSPAASGDSTAGPQATAAGALAEPSGYESGSDRASSEISRAAVNDSSLCAMYGSLMKLDMLDNIKATADLVNRLVPLNVKPGATIQTRAAHRRSLVSERSLAAAAGGGIRGSMVDLRSTGSADGANLLAARRAHSSWALNAAATAATTPLDGELKRRLLALRRDSAASDRASADSLLLEQAEEPVYDDVANDEDGVGGGGSSGGCTRLAGDRLPGGGRRLRYGGGRSCGSLDELSLAEESDELVQSYETDAASEELAGADAGAAIGEDTEDEGEEPEESAVVETNLLKTALVVSGGEGYANHVYNIVECQTEATILLWQHTQKSATALAF